MVAIADTAVHAAITVVGDRHDELQIPNQDAHATAANRVFAVADGHGPDGTAVAVAAVNVLVASVMSRMDKVHDRTPVERIISLAFAEASHAVDKLPAAQTSGATASLVVLERGKATVANVGDSDVVFARAGATAIVVSKRHRPSVSSERQRVQAAGAVLQNDYVCDAEIPTKMISVTRTLGDLDIRSLGISTEPSLSSFELSHPDDFIIIATDGLWDAHACSVTPQSAVDAARKCLHLDDPLTSISIAVEELMALAKGNYYLPIDDTTIMVVRPGAQLIESDDIASLQRSNCSDAPTRRRKIA